MEKQLITPSKLDILPGILILLGISFANLYAYLLFHSLAEMFGIIIAFAIFIVAWNSRRFHDDSYFLFIGLAYAFIGGLDILHTLAYKGMGVFPGYDADLSTQLWIIARYIESASLFIAPLLCGRKLNIRFVFFVYTLVISLLMGSIFSWDIFPRCFIEGVGLTPFKKISEYIIALILTAAVVMLFQKRNQFNESIFRLLAASIILTIGSELAFTLYIDVYGLFNQVGHLLKIVSFYLIYKAIIQTTLTKPYDLLFRKLKQHEESLLKAKEAAESANRAKSAFLATMSHELRTPLNGILGYAQILQDSPSLNQSLQEGLDIIERNGRNLLTLINDVLDLAKIESGRIDIIQSNSHLNTFLRDIYEVVRPRAEQKGIIFRWQPFDFARDRPIDWDTGSEGPSLPSHVRGDARRLRQVLINLLGNAIKFTDRGGVMLKVGLIIGNREKGVPAKIRFQIEDTGIGIAPEHLASIFEPFHQVSDAPHRKEGTGLGLAISRNFIESMGSQLRVKSTPGEGSTFWFDAALPVVVEGVETTVEQTRKIIASLLITPPPQEEVAALYELSLMGDINELEIRVAALEQSDRRLKPFALEMQRLIKDFQLNKISKLLERYLE